MQSTKEILLEHSEAKVELFSYYLATYLQIIHRVDFIERIYLLDLFAGEGKYSDNKKGSPLAIIERMRNYYFQYREKCKEIKILLNDSEQSTIEPLKKKIERVQDFINEGFTPPNIGIKYTDKDFNDILPVLIKKVENLSNSERALIFIDPWGYKEIKPSELKALLTNRKTEMLLFLPVSYMYRFVNKTLRKDEFPGGRALASFLEDLYRNEQPITTNVSAFINSMKKQFKKVYETPYVDTFTLQRDKTNTYCLFFFTFNKKGYEKMIEAKWKVDKEKGKGYFISEGSNLFSEIEAINYDELIWEYILQNDGVTNHQLTDFGYNNGFLPTHTTQVLARLKQKNKIELCPLDNKDVKGFYIGNISRQILIKKLGNYGTDKN